MNVNKSLRTQQRFCKKREEAIVNELKESIYSELSTQPEPSSGDDHFSATTNSGFFPSQTGLSVDDWNDFGKDYDSNTSITSASSVEDNKNHCPSILDLLRKLVLWSIQYNIPNSATTALLHILNPFLPGLPLDARSLLSTPRSCGVESCGDGKFKYFGIKSHLLEKIPNFIPSYHPIMEPVAKDFLEQGTSLITVSINVDGLPISSSSTKSFWPILGVVDQNIERQPFLIGIYCGDSKPVSSNTFLRPLVDECLDLEKNGVVYEGKKYSFRVSCFIADAPARQFLKCIASHCSSHACEKCTQEGTSYNRRMTWQLERTQSPLRTDEAFKQTDFLGDHQYGPSVLSELSIGLVTQVPLDYLHLMCLGITKKLVRVWVDKGPKQCKLRASAIENISSRLKIIASSHIPSEFSRRPRPLHTFKFWKATEYRSFMLYIGPVVLFKILPDELFQHFTVFHVIAYILTSDKGSDLSWRNYCQELISHFLHLSSSLYGREFLIYNFHNLTHLPNDVKNYGSLDRFSAFPFENHMKVIKNMVRSHNNAIEQVIKRLGERKLISCNKNPKISVKRNAEGFFKCIPFSDGSTCCIGTGIKDGCFCTFKNEILVVNKIRKKCGSSSYLLECNVFKFKDDYFKIPLKSSKLGIFVVDKLEKKEDSVNSVELKYKCFLLPNFGQNNDSFVCIPFCNMDSFY
ncbi:uncharacterized protein LOC111054008 isoform X1 [Nilaparvata lugens]|uniref:uncharacterized protein LOC111054008 isoform X1 n=1 Tax=Nilaparvata lugens TaxID=108931 RepID=UPI00193E53FD|nr:uncharacterized protein LOC111054008 isoform X1 [Nilaparvata lugens]XP_039299878.1 uncharacterized protein LOC111054008 isoform X1 [Nilaparvata lugens]XP_039299879.1 uncharacterized protein LOC111054008 isoform X1 [Nilaparvata lugens]XP_039299880.1 uncharacterized protein LOC111054008 isoform X1 [Nilaparvata lugens]